jgi:hypothetical protein
MNIFDSGIQFSKQDVVEKAISALYNKKGIEKALLITEYDRKEIIGLEEKDEQNSSCCFGIKNNVGMKQALGSDFLISFITNRDYEWPENNLKIVHRGEVIGEDITDAAEIERLKKSGKYRVFGNIVIDRKKFKDIKYSFRAPEIVIDAKPCPEVEKLAFVSEAMIASPSKLTDEYIKSKLGIKSKDHIGSFLVGFNFGTCQNSLCSLESNTSSHMIQS